jgi:hypothetical protein
MVRKGLHMHGDIELTRHRTYEYYDDVLGAKIKSLVYACLLTMALPSASPTVLTISPSSLFYSDLALVQ